MTTDQARDLAAQAAGADGAATGGGGPPPTPPSISDLLADESKHSEAIPVGQVKEWFESQRGSLITEVEERIRRETQERQAAEQATADQNAAAQEDIDFAKAIYVDLASPDAEVRTAAESKMQQNRDRYNRGRDMQFRRESTEAQMKAVNGYMEPIWHGVRQAGHEKLIDEVFKDRDALIRHNGNWMLLAMEYAENRGYEKGKTEAADANDQDRRIDDGASGAPSFRSPSGAQKESITEGIQLGAPGSTRQLRQRFESKQQ